MAGDPLPPAFYPVGLNLVGRRCVVIGGDREAEQKARALLEVGAEVERIRDSADVREDALHGAFLIISTPQNAALSARLRALADEHRILLCTIDQPAYGFVAMQAVVASGPARIAISTGGVAPGVGKILKAALERALDATFARFLERLAAERRKNRAALPAPEARRDAMQRLTDGFEVTVDVRYPAWFRDVP